MIPATPVALRIAGPFATALGPGDSLEAQNTTLLADGAIAQVNDVGLQYFLDKESAAAPSGTTVIKPATGSPGRWFRQSGLAAVAVTSPITGDGTPGSPIALGIADSTHWKGGSREVADIVARDAIPVANRAFGMMVFVQDLQLVYQLGSDLSTWFLYDASPALSLQAEWYVDITNGNNNNSGRAGEPLQDLEELGRRLFPNGTRLMLNAAMPLVTIHIAAGTYTHGFFAAGAADEGSVNPNQYRLRIVCAKAESAPMILSAAANPAAPITRGEISTLAGGFTYKKRLRITSGASAGAVAYSTGLNAGALNTYLSGLVLPTFEGFHVFSGANVGDTVQEETPLVLIRRAEFNAGPQVRITIENAQIIRATVNGVCSETPSGDAGGNVTFSACTASGGFSIWQCNAGGANMFGCNISNATVFQGFGWLFWGCVNQGLMGISNGSISSYGFTIDAGVLITNVMANFEFKTTQGASRFTAEQSYNGTGTIEVQNGGNSYGIGACINVLTGGEFVNAGRGSGSYAGQSEIWGSSGQYAIGFYCAPGGHMYQDPVNSTGDEFLACWGIPSAINLRIGNTDYAYSKTARPDPNNNCGLMASRYI